MTMHPHGVISMEHNPDDIGMTASEDRAFSIALTRKAPQTGWAFRTMIKSASVTSGRRDHVAGFDLGPILPLVGLRGQEVVGVAELLVR